MKFASDAQKVFAISYAAARVKSVTIHRVDISNVLHHLRLLLIYYDFSFDDTF
jgi:hypothetical protein